jgi:hypothetical protein
MLGQPMSPEVADIQERAPTPLESSHFWTLKRKIERRQAVSAVCGLGYVGLPLVRAVATEGYNVIGFDIDPEKVSQLNAGKSYIHHIASETIADLVSKGQFSATRDFPSDSRSGHHLHLRSDAAQQEPGAGSVLRGLYGDKCGG